MSSTHSATLSDFDASTSEGAVRVSAQLSLRGETREVFFSVSAPEGDLARVMPSPEPFVIGLLWPLMRQGHSIRVDAPVDSDLRYQLAADVVPLPRSTNPELSSIEISAPTATVAPQAMPGAGAATGMSCGLDSLTTLKESRALDFPESRKIRRFLFHNVGSHGQQKTSRVFSDRLLRARFVARDEGIPLIEIDSNLDDFYSDGFVRSHTLRNAAAAYLVRPIVQTYMYSSTYGYGGVHARRTKGIGSADPILLPLLSTRKFRLLSTGTGCSRLEKTIQYIEDPIHLGAFDICTRPNASETTNCGTCGKCGRFLLVAENLGALDRFSDVFDLDAYYAARSDVIAQMMRAGRGRLGDVNDLDHLNYLRRQGADLPASVVDRLHLRTVPGVSESARVMRKAKTNALRLIRS